MEAAKIERRAESQGPIALPLTRTRQCGSVGGGSCAAFELRRWLGSGQKWRTGVEQVARQLQQQRPNLFCPGSLTIRFSGEKKGRPLQCLRSRRPPAAPPQPALDV